MNRNTILILICTAAVAAPATLTMDDAVRNAMRHNRSVAAARSKIDERAAQLAAAKTRRWPVSSTMLQFGPSLTRANVTFPAGAFGTYEGTGPLPGEDIRVGIPRQLSGFSYSQAALPLTQQWRIGAAIEVARLEREVSGREAEVAEREIAQQTRQTYLAILSLDAARAAARARTALAAEVERLASGGVTAGVALPAEAREAAARLERARAAQAELDAERENLREQLNALMGSPLDAEWDFWPPVLDEPGAANAAQAQALAAAQRPELEAARLRIRQAEAEARGKRSEFVPDVSLSVSHFGFLNTGNLAPSNFAVAGVTVQWEPWDWGRKKHELAALRHRREQELLSHQEGTQQVSRQAGAAWRAWKQSETNLAAARTALTASEESLRVARARYEKEAALLRQLLEAQADFEAAQEQEVRAFAARGTAWANLQFALGSKP